MAAAETIALSALLAGVLDISAASVVMALQGTPPKRLLQFVASGALGASAFNGGNGTAGIGLLLHFLIAAIWAVMYYATGLSTPVISNHPLLFGVFYGTAIHLVMSRIVVPLSRAPKRPFSMKAFLIQLVIHIFCVGLPIALTQSHLSR